ncbi:hypothetical protein J6590_012029 [Homalodisca vitripennis]|nr:hypothetical protein J6590_012029 [Homalodisca vitripennis]
MEHAQIISNGDLCKLSITEDPTTNILTRKSRCVKSVNTIQNHQYSPASEEQSGSGHPRKEESTGTIISRTGSRSPGDLEESGPGTGELTGDLRSIVVLRLRECVLINNHIISGRAAPYKPVPAHNHNRNIVEWRYRFCRCNCHSRELGLLLIDGCAGFVVVVNSDGLGRWRRLQKRSASLEGSQTRLGVAT